MNRSPVRLVILILSLVFIIACISTPAPAPAGTLPPTSEIPATSAETVGSTPTSQPGANPTVASGTLWLNILSPLDQAVVNVPQIEVVGQAPPDTVVSINDEVVVVGPEGQFTTVVALVEGPNAIEIVASDVEGTEVDTILSVVYQP
jgi:hypothetical protein